MSVLFELEAKGNKAELLRKYDKLGSVFSNPKHHAGVIAHITVETEDGIRIMDLMESEEHMDKLLNDPELNKALADHNFETIDFGSSTTHKFKVHNFHVVK
jgi:hypothetical protein